MHAHLWRVVATVRVRAGLSDGPNAALVSRAWKVMLPLVSPMLNSLTWLRCQQPAPAAARAGRGVSKLGSARTAAATRHRSASKPLHARTVMLTLVCNRPAHAAGGSERRKPVRLRGQDQGARAELRSQLQPCSGISHLRVHVSARQE